MALGLFVVVVMLAVCGGSFAAGWIFHEQRDRGG